MWNRIQFKAQLQIVFSKHILIRQSTWSLRGLEPFFVAGCLQNCRPSSYCDNQTANFQNSPLGGDVVLWRTLEETRQQAPESGLWAQIPVPSSPSSCVALVKSLNRLQLVFKMEEKKNLLLEIAEKLSGIMFVGCLAQSVCPLLLGPAPAALRVLGHFSYHQPPKKQGCGLHAAVGTGFLWPLSCCQGATSAVFFLHLEVLTVARSTWETLFWPAGNWSVHRKQKEKSKHRVKCMRKDIILPISY